MTPLIAIIQAPTKSSKKPASAPGAKGKKVVQNPLFEARPKTFGIGESKELRVGLGQNAKFGSAPPPHHVACGTNSFRW